MQRVADVQEMAFRPGKGPPGAGTGSGVQALPFHSSASGRISSAAMQVVALAQETAPKPNELAGTGSAVQMLPFHDSASALGKLPLLSANTPVAMQAVAVAHEMPLKPLLTGPAGSTAASLCQAVPFHISARA